MTFPTFALIAIFGMFLFYYGNVVVYAFIVAFFVGVIFVPPIIAFLNALNVIVVVGAAVGTATLLLHFMKGNPK